MRSQLKSYLSVSKKEWNGLVILVILIALILAAPYVYQMFGKDNTINVNDFDAAVALLNKGKAAHAADPSSDDKLATPVMFSFNPNHLPAEKWKALGLSGKQIAIIQHYEAKGGRFYKKEDVKKIYTITADDYKQLEPFIALPSTDKSAGKTSEIIELNGADSARLTQLPGIWPSMAERIVHYRDRLGGFCRKEQLKEVFGLDGEKYQAIKELVTVNRRFVKKIQINKVDFGGLSHFPYLTFKQMNAVIAYRDQHGDYESIGDMSNIVLLDQATLHKIEPYLLFK